jgi:hypothetical protein
VLHARVTRSELRQYKAAADRIGLSLSEFVRWWLKEGTLAGKRAR